MTRMLAVVRLPTGKSVVAKLPLVTQQMADYAQERVQDVVPKLMQLQKDTVAQLRGRRLTARASTLTSRRGTVAAIACGRSAARLRARRAGLCCAAVPRGGDRLARPHLSSAASSSTSAGVS